MIEPNDFKNLTVHRPLREAQRREIQTISPDYFKSWTRCKKQFYYKYVRRMNWPSDARHFKLGRDVHKLLDYQARGLNCDLLLKYADDNVRQSWEKLMAHPVAHLPVLANEWGFHVPVSDHWLVGRMDRVAVDGDQVLIIDWKTGTGVPKNAASDWQTLVYLYALVEISRGAAPHGLTVNGRPLEALRAEQVQFVYVEVKADAASDVRLVRIDYNEAQHADSARRFGQIISDVGLETDFDLPGKCPDRYCAYQPICGIDVLAD